MSLKHTTTIRWFVIISLIVVLSSIYSVNTIFNSSLIGPVFAQISNLNAEPTQTQVQGDEVVVKNVGILSVTTGVNDLTSRPLDEKFTVTDITNEITGITAEPKIFQATTQPQIVELASTGTYGVTVFLKVEDVSGTLTQLVNLAKIQDIIDDQGGFTDLLPLLQFISNGQISNECTGNSSIGTTNSCTIVITFYDEYLDIIEDFVGFDIAGISGTGGNLDQGNQLESASGGVLGAALTTGNLPVDVCKLDQTQNPPISSADFRPISATYYFDGVADISELREIARDSDALVDGAYPSKNSVQQLIFDILFDNNNPNIKSGTAASSVKITPANSIFKSSIYGNQEPFNHDKAPFSIDQIRTECKWISIANAQTSYKGSKQSSADGTEIFALGQLDESPPSKKTQVPSELSRDPSTKLGTQSGGLLSATNKDTAATLGTLGTSANTNILNPPFVACNNVFQASSNGQNVLSNYKIVAGFDRDSLDGVHGDKKISLRVTVDLIPTDQALITENNNELIKLNLVINPGEKEERVEIVPLSLITISTDCLGISYSDDLVVDLS